MVALATFASVIASQALISGAFSITMQAIQLGYLPRMNIRHTSSEERGQIYMPSVNWALLLGCIGLVLGFQNSSRLSAAYGIAVTLTMDCHRRCCFSLPRGDSSEMESPEGRQHLFSVYLARAGFLRSQCTENHPRRLVPTPGGGDYFHDYDHVENRTSTAG